ncbi:lipid A-modifier LpxR family protein [Brevundimonas staleyi]|uniref:Lipid A-modifier LpxR family protein n=1 Tax=Brevundimonas staleyi TaxID=74326 RepID=A0ABW0FS45_9CAUL
MIRLRHLVLSVAALAALSVPASAQTWVNQNWSEAQQETASSITARLNSQVGFSAPPVREFAPVVEFASDYTPVEERSAFAATTTRDVWREADGYSDRLRLRTRGELRRADGAPLPLTSMDQAMFDADGYDVSYTRGWNAARGYTASGLEVTLSPHVGIGAGDRGGTAEAGATLRIGSSADRILPEGSAAFGERARWYIYAAGSGTAVGYNFARNRDGEYARSGYSRDSGSFLGDASLGVAMRKGDMQGSFGLVYREIRAEGISGHGIDNDVSEGLVAFQLSIKPKW